MTTTQSPDLHFVRDLRRTLYLSEMMKMAIECLSMNEGASGDLLRPLLAIREQIDRYYQRLYKLSPATWPAVVADLQGDMPQDIMLLVDTVADVKNLGEIIGILESAKVKEPLTSNPPPHERKQSAAGR